MLIVKKLSLNFGQQVIFEDISFTVNSNERIGLVGRNGSGKTTLLKIISDFNQSGTKDFDSGQIEIYKNKKIAYLPQQVILESKKDILHEALNSFITDLGYLGDLIHEYNDLENKINSLHNHEVNNLERYSNLQILLNELNFEKKVLETKKILLGLGFSESILKDSVQTLSVGWKMRLVLAKLLLQKADFYLFDEATNHLDLVAKDWFLAFLQNANFGFMLVCHDRYFLDKLCSQIYELSLGQLNIYTGNYSKYLEQKEHDKQLLEQKYIEQQKYIKKEMAVIDRFRASASRSNMAQSKLKALEKLELVKIEPMQKIVKIKFNNVKQAGKIVLTVKNLAKSFGDKLIFKNVNFEIDRGEKVAIVAPNGQGKSTLLNMIMENILCEDPGSKIIFGHNVFPAFFEQDQNKTLNPKKTIYQEVEDSCKTTEQRQKIRTILGSFLFSGDDIEKTISVLSGGEKNRVAMVKVLLQDANFLILDEPTNHLDIESKEVLLSVLKDYPGTILFVSHDRDFLNNLSTAIIELKQDSSYKYKGNYDAFLEQKDAQQNVIENVKNIELRANHIEHALSSRARTRDPEIKHSNNFSKNDYETRKQIRALESKIEKQEKELELLTKKFENLEYGSKDYNKVLNEINKIEKELNENLALWEILNS